MPRLIVALSDLPCTESRVVQTPRTSCLPLTVYCLATSWRSNSASSSFVVFIVIPVVDVEGRPHAGTWRYYNFRLNIYQDGIYLKPRENGRKIGKIMITGLSR